MKRFLFAVLFVVILLSNHASAQQISISRPTRTYQWSGPSRTFNDRFYGSSLYVFSLDSSEVYQSKKIKKVEILSMDSTVNYMVEFDSSGHLLKYGSGGFSSRYFRVFQNGKLSNGKSFSTTEYYENKILKRIDSSFTDTVRIRKGDTVFICKYTLDKTYQYGMLLNEHGQYINDMERRVPQGFKYIPWRYRIKIRCKKAFKNTFTRPYKTNYNEKQLYLTNERMYAICIGYTVGPDTLPVLKYKGSLKSWLVQSNYGRNYVRCENYREKVVERSIPGCYTDKARFDEEQSHLNDGVQYAKNKDGMYIGYYKDGYPVFMYRYTYFE